MKLLKDQQKLITSLSHDLRNPLGAVLAYAELLLTSDEPLSPKATRQIEAIRRAATRIDGMIQKLVDLSRLEAGLIQIERAPCDAGLLVSEIVRRHGEAAKKKNIALHVERPARLLPVAADLNRLTDVLDVLVANAIQYGTTGTTVTVTLTQDAAGTRFSVKDAGPGFREDEAEAYLGASSGDHARPARGLSLYLARRLTEAHGGKLSLRTSEKGSELSFVIAAAPLSSRGDQLSSSAQASRNQPPAAESQPTDSQS